ncbi:Ail/Lom family outer membrane beta-barrel protein [Salmonella enterica subsp. enterica]|nr:Ail/Lom family outer membrane beta-barrel protein [Salmonella enterica subsp. enterica]
MRVTVNSRRPITTQPGENMNSAIMASHGAGLQFNPMENVALDFSYEQAPYS